MEDKDTVIKELKQALRIKSDETEQLQVSYRIYRDFKQLFLAQSGYVWISIFSC